MKIVSFVPGATELVAALGQRQSLVGVTHACRLACDLEGVAAEVLTYSAVPAGVGAGSAGSSSRGSTSTGEWMLSAGAFAKLAPDLVILPLRRAGSGKTGGLDVEGLREAVRRLDPMPRIHEYGPGSVRELLGSVRAMGEAVGRGAEAARLVAELQRRVETVARRTAISRRPRVALLSSMAPPIGAGGIFAELIEIAGGRPIVCGKDEDSRALDWTHVTGVKPEVLLFAPEGMDLEMARAAAERVRAVSALRETPAARWGQVHLLDASRYFGAVGTITVRSLELLASLVHPELAWPEDVQLGAAWRPLSLD